MYALEQLAPYVIACVPLPPPQPLPHNADTRRRIHYVTDIYCYQMLSHFILHRVLVTNNVYSKTIRTQIIKTAIKVKKARLHLVQSPGYTEISSSANRKVVWYYVINIENIQNYIEFFYSIKSELVELLKSLASKHPIKFNLKV